MWPWSIIRRLRNALAEKTKEAELWERSYNRANERYDALERTRIENMEALRRQIVQLADERDAEIVKLGIEKTTNVALKSEADSLRMRQKAMSAEINELRAQLAQLTTRGPGGRFVKVDQVGGKSSGEIGH